MSRIDRSIETADEWLPGPGVEVGVGSQKQLLSGHGVSLWGDGNALHLVRGDGCTAV